MKKLQFLSVLRVDYYTFKGDTLEECENEINHEKINKIKLGY